MKPPETRYVRTRDGVDIAYCVHGDGPVDILAVPQLFSHLEFEWEHPQARAYFERLACFSRLIRFDKRGAGLSDRIGDVAPTVDDRLEDIHAVMKATETDRPVLLGTSEGGGICAMFAATQPDLVRALVMCNAPIGVTQDEEIGLGITPEMYETVTRALEDNWGTGITASIMEAAAGPDPTTKDWWARLERLAGTPKSIIACWRMNYEFDVTPALPLVQVPTLLVYRTKDLWHVQGRHAAQRIPDAKFLEFPGSDHIPWAGDWEPIADAIEEFITGRHPLPRADRALATVLFTDLVASTAKGAEVGDRAWHSLLDAFDDRSGREVQNWNGTVVKSTGDGHLATFAGPTSAIRCASAIRDAVRPLGIQVRSGLHTGEIELRPQDVTGIAVNIASRVSSLANADEILVSRTVTDLVAGSGLEFDDRGEHELKGVPGRWRLYAVK